jgi:hypothetical protein
METDKIIYFIIKANITTSFSEETIKKALSPFMDISEIIGLSPVVKIVDK